jgi:predicted amidohydrolase
MRAAAVQMEAVLGDLDANLEMCSDLAERAADDGAEWIALPEFFTTGVGFDERLAGAALAPDGAATALLTDIAKRRGVTIGGSFLCRDPDGEVRNAYLLATPEGIAGRHDKDLPTMWESALYVEGHDDGIIEAGDLTVGAAVCWELMRTQTVHRLAGKIDLLMSGSGWWSVPPWPPRAVTRRIEAANARGARKAAEVFSAFIGAPVIHAAHSGELECDTPWSPFRYRGHFEGGAVIVDARGNVLGRRGREEGPGHVISEVEPGSVSPVATAPDRFWLHDRGALGTFFWNYQRAHGPRWYARHVRGLPPAQPAWKPRAAAGTQA